VDIKYLYFLAADFVTEVGTPLGLWWGHMLHCDMILTSRHIFANRGFEKD